MGRGPEFTLQGELQIDEYADAYVFALRFDNLLALDPIKLKEKLGSLS